MKRLLKITCLFLTVTPIFFGELVNAQCDKGLNAAQSSDGYKQRSNRCEGFYESQVASESFNIVGITQGKFRFKLDAKEKITISSSVVLDNGINIRAVGIPAETFYRMDAQISPIASLEWPVGEILYPNKLTYKDVGIYGWTGKINQKTYVPLSVITDLYGQTENNIIYVYLRASIDVKNVQWRFADVSQDGNCAKAGDWISQDKDRIYRSGTRIICKIPTNETGLICISVSADGVGRSDELSCDAKILLP